QTLLRVKPGRVVNSSERINPFIRRGLLEYYNKDQRQVHDINSPAGQRTQLLESFVQTYSYALLDGRRITPTDRSIRNSAGSSIIQAKIAGKPVAQAGEIRSLFIHPQYGIEGSSTTLLAAIEWMEVSEVTPLENPVFIWDDYPELGVETWTLDKYLDRDATDLPLIMPLAHVNCQLSRGRVEHIEPPLWMTVTMDR
ncbi:hypothetical protein C8R43DRAFT_1160531, partial [Mycena crocata]